MTADPPARRCKRAVAVNLEAMCNTFWYNVACQEEVIWLRLQTFMLVLAHFAMPMRCSGNADRLIGDRACGGEGGFMIRALGDIWHPHWGIFDTRMGGFMRPKRGINETQARDL